MGALVFLLLVIAALLLLARRRRQLLGTAGGPRKGGIEHSASEMALVDGADDEGQVVGGLVPLAGAAAAAVDPPELDPLEAEPPTALRLIAGTDFRTDHPVDVGSRPTVRGTLYDVHAIQRNGAAACLVTTTTTVAETASSDAPSDQLRRVKREVMALLALADHGGAIVKVVGYTEAPTASLLTRFYPTDLAHVLFNDGAAALAPAVVRQLCTKMATAVAIVHATGFAHCNIQAASFRVQPAAAGGAGADAADSVRIVLADFDAVRTVDAAVPSVYVEASPHETACMRAR